MLIKSLLPGLVFFAIISLSAHTQNITTPRIPSPAATVAQSMALFMMMRNGEFKVNKQEDVINKFLRLLPFKMIALCCKELPDDELSPAMSG